MIGILDYGMGNLYSVKKALERLDCPYILTDNVDELTKVDGLILPGVGSFRDAMKLLHEKDMVSFLQQIVADKIPLLGICLGMQLLFEESEENGLTGGLGLLRGRAVRFLGMTESKERYKVPHMGWNKLNLHHSSPLLQGIDADGYVYFVHSYYIDTDDQEVILASSSYDVDVPAVVGKGIVYGTQFHPEKSGDVGMKILQNFVNITKRRVG